MLPLPCGNPQPSAPVAHRSVPGSSLLGPGITWLPKASAAAGCASARVANSWLGCSRSSSETVPLSSPTATSFSLVASARAVTSTLWQL